MPNQNFCGPREDLIMGDCGLSLPYASSKAEEKLCKYSYASWCPTCDKDSPRRRSKSETNEPCKRKGKEMKTLTPKNLIEARNMKIWIWNMKQKIPGMIFTGLDQIYVNCQQHTSQTIAKLLPNCQMGHQILLIILKRVQKISKATPNLPI